MSPGSRFRFSVGVLAATALLCCPDAYSQGDDRLKIEQELFGKPAHELAQVRTDSALEDDSPADSAAPDSASDMTEEAPDSEAPETEFVFAGDLAKTLRKIDPDAKVDWDGKKLRIRANGQEFAVFPSGKEMVVNGDIESDMPPLKIRNGEIYIPQQAINRIGKSLEKPVGAAETTTTIVATPTPTPTPTPDIITPTPVAEATTRSASILPDTTPAVATPTVTPGSITVLPNVTPKASATPLPATPVPSVNQQPVATPFPQATPSPTPVATATPRPTRTPAPVKGEATAEPKKTGLAANTEAFKAALRDKISLGGGAGSFTIAQLEAKAAERKVKKVLIYADQSGLVRDDKYGKQSASISLQIAERVKGQLEAAGIAAQLTRSDDKRVPVGDTLETLQKSDAQVLLIVSVGYSTAFEDLGGFRLFYMNESVDYHSLNKRSFDASETVPDEYNYRSFQGQTKVLVSALSNSVSAALENRAPIGTNPVPDYLTRRAPMAAATVVVGYLSNPADARRLIEATSQDAMAAALAEGIRNYAAQLSQGDIDTKAGGGN